MEKNEFMIGNIKENFVGRKLPTNGKVLCIFLYQHKICRLTLKQSACVTIKKVEEIWSQAGLKICTNINAVKKTSKLFSEWLSLKKNNYRKKSFTQKKREELFKKKARELFDVAQSDLVQQLDDSKQLFLESQRSTKRYGLIDAPDIRPVQVTMDIDVDGPYQAGSSDTDRDNRVISRHQSHTTEVTSCSQNSDIDFEMQLSQNSAPLKRDVMTAELASALDRANISNRNATFVLAAAYQSVGLNIETLNLSYSTIRRCRISYRKTVAESLKDEFKAEDRYIVHWDGKILADLMGSSSVDRIAIVLSTGKVTQLLGAPKISDGTSENHSIAILNTLKEWNVTTQIRAMCFDTPPVNTGMKNGTAALIEKKLERKLIWLPCRHHIYEIMFRGVFEVYWTTTSGPKISIFGRFKNFWNEIDQAKYESGMKDEIVAEAVAIERTDIIHFIRNLLKVSQPRSDYKELLELALIFLDGHSESIKTFKCPGALHHARWMAKAIYSLKIFMFREQFSLSFREIGDLRQVCIFVILFYIKVWFRATSATQAPNNDLQLLKKLLLWKQVAPLVQQKALKKLGEHLWYLNEELAAMALFDNHVSEATKRKMCEAIRRNEGSRNIEDKRYVFKGIDLNSFLFKDLDEFVSRKSLRLFETFDLPYDFIEEDISLWSSSESYIENFNFFKDLSVLNDSAERGIALIGEYNKCLTKNEEQLQFLLQGVNEHRRHFPNCNKNTLSV